MQPSHWLFCPHPCPRPRVPFPQNRPTGRYLSRQDGGCAGAESGRPGWLGHFPLTLLWDGPGGLGFASSGDALDRYDPRLGPQKNLKVPEGGIKAFKRKTGKTPPSLSPGSLPPSGQGAPGNLPSKRPPHANTHKHTHTVRRSLAWWGRGGGSGLGEKRASFPFRPEVVLLRNSSHQEELQRLPQGGFPGHSGG